MQSKPICVMTHYCYIEIDITSWNMHISTVFITVLLLGNVNNTQLCDKLPILFDACYSAQFSSENVSCIIFITMKDNHKLAATQYVDDR